MPSLPRAALLISFHIYHFPKRTYINDTDNNKRGFPFYICLCFLGFCPVWKVPPKNQNKSCCVWADYRLPELMSLSNCEQPSEMGRSVLLLMGHSSLQEQTRGGQALELAFYLGWWGHFLNGILLQWQFWVWITPFMWYFQQLHQLWPPLPRRTRKLRAANGLTQLWVPRQESVTKQISPRLPLFLFSSLSDIYCNSWKAAFSWHSTFYLRCCAEQAIPQIKGKVCLRTILGLKWKLP